MAEQDERDEQAGSTRQAAAKGAGDQTGDPGRTPGSAEGDEETVDQDIKDKEEKGQL
ncbi:MAG TPA: hypothetical protein VF723_18210 [Pyrinomonadaceae bacterium]|jgi:hypothetical protein